MDNIHDRTGKARALIVRARGEAALVDQHDDRFNALGLQLRDQSIDRLGLICKTSDRPLRTASRWSACP
jgi:hypothetical protein